MSTNLGRSAHAVFRIVVGLLFLQHGLQKLFGLLGGMDGSGATAPVVSLMGLAGVLELFGGALIIAGLLTRGVSAVLLLEMVVAYAMAHLPQGGWPIQNQGELALLYGAAFVFLAGNGAGPFSLDARNVSRAHEHRPDRRHGMDDRRAHAA